jgi:hypothetical protein
MYLTTSQFTVGISCQVAASALVCPKIATAVPVLGTISGWQFSSLLMMPLSGALEWTLLVLLVLIAIVSLRILLTRKKYKEELNQLSDIEKDL